MITFLDTSRQIADGSATADADADQWKIFRASGSTGRIPITAYLITTDTWLPEQKGTYLDLIQNHSLIRSKEKDVVYGKTDQRKQREE